MPAPMPPSRLPLGDIYTLRVAALASAFSIAAETLRPTASICSRASKRLASSATMYHDPYAHHGVAIYDGSYDGGYPGGNAHALHTGPHSPQYAMHGFAVRSVAPAVLIFPHLVWAVRYVCVAVCRAVYTYACMRSSLALSHPLSLSLP